MSSVDFKKVLRKGHSIKFNNIKFTYRASFRHSVGFTVSKKYGIAVKRNVFKRRCRAAYNETFINSIFDCALIVSPHINDIGWKQIKISFNKLSEYIYDK